MNKNKYVYRNNLLMSNPYKEVKVQKKNIFQRIMCHHNFQYLVKEKTDSVFLNPNGDVMGYK